MSGRPTGGAYSTPPDLLARFRDLLLKGRGCEGREEEGKWCPTFWEKVTPLAGRLFQAAAG